MKKKLDFVTNSSSCSFIAWGVSMSLDELRKQCGPAVFQLAKQKEADKAKKNGAIMAMTQSKEDLQKEYEEFVNSDDFQWEVEYVIDGLSLSQMPYEEEVMIGKSPFSQKDDQTLGDFKKEICEKFKAIGLDFEPKDLYQIEEAWMDN